MIPEMEVSKLEKQQKSTLCNQAVQKNDFEHLMSKNGLAIGKQT